MTKQRKHVTPEEKVAMLRRHLVEKVPVSTVCEDAAIRPSQFYLWHKQFSENGVAAFQPGPRSKPDQAQQRIAAWSRNSRPTTRSWPNWRGSSSP